MRLSDFDFELPQELIALRPASPRHDARLLHVAGDAPFADRHVRDLPQLLHRGDVLVMNDTRVIPAQLQGVRGAAHVGVTLHKREDLARWWAFVKNAKRLREGDVVAFGAGLIGHVEARDAQGAILFRFESDLPLEAALEQAGTMPLPPYIAAKRQIDEKDAEDYQTIYAREAGAVAAPTAGLHFTPALMYWLDQAGIVRETLTLHVGAGTFLPVKVEDISTHQMHAEWGRITAETAQRLNKARAEGRRIIAVGTTSLRLLESAAVAEGRLQPFVGDTSIFITPGYRFKFVQGLMTNFHLPKSTLFMLVSALMGLEKMQAVYAHAIAQKYRFYSYGDSSLLMSE